MKRDPLSEALRALPIPSAEEAAKARALHRSLLVLKGEGLSSSPVESRDASAWVQWKRPLLIALAACCAALIWLGVMERRHAEETVALRQVLKGMEDTFQNQLSAVVLKDGEAKVFLAKEGATSSDKPLLITIHAPHERDETRILTFGGQWIDLPLNGQSVRVQVLETASGGFVLLGDHFLWDGRHPAIGGIRIEGRFL